MQIRTDDINEICQLGISMHHKSRFKKWPVNLERSSFILDRIKDEEAVFAHFDVDGNDKICAVVIGEVTTDHSVDIEIASTIMVYGDGTPTGVKKVFSLIKSFENWAKNKADIVSVDVSGGVNDQRVSEILFRRGYEDGGRRVVKETNRGT